MVRPPIISYRQGNPVDYVAWFPISSVIKIRSLRAIKGIYGIHNTVTGYTYVGSAVYLSGRLGKHLKFHKSNVHLSNAAKHSGWVSFNIVIFSFVPGPYYPSSQY